MFRCAEGGWNPLRVLRTYGFVDVDVVAADVVLEIVRTKMIVLV